MQRTQEWHSNRSRSALFQDGLDAITINADALTPTPVSRDDTPSLASARRPSPATDTFTNSNASANANANSISHGETAELKSYLSKNGQEGAGGDVLNGSLQLLSRCNDLISPTTLNIDREVLPFGGIFSKTMSASNRNVHEHHVARFDDTGISSNTNNNSETSKRSNKSATNRNSLKARRSRLAQTSEQKWVSMDAGETLNSTSGKDSVGPSGSQQQVHVLSAGIPLYGAGANGSSTGIASRKTSTVSDRQSSMMVDRSEVPSPTAFDPLIAKNSKARTIIVQTRRRDTVRVKNNEPRSPPSYRNLIANVAPPQLVVTDSTDIDFVVSSNLDTAKVDCLQANSSMNASQSQPQAQTQAQAQTPGQAQPQTQLQTQASKPADARQAGVNNNWKDQVIAFFQPSDNKLAMKLFGTKSALLKERRRQQQTGHWIIHPCSNFRFYWDFWMLLILIANMIILPVAISFFQEDDENPDASGQFDFSWIFLFNIVSDVIFVFDIIINFRTGVILNDFADEILLDPGQIAYHYLRTWFTVDFISSVPFDYIYKAIDSSSSAGFNYHLMHAGRALRILRLAKLLSLLRLLRFSRLVRYVTQWEEFLNIATMVMRVFNLVLLILLLGHWNACLQFLVPMLREFPADSWVSIQELKDRPWLEQYTWAIFKALSHMLCIGYGQFPPQSLSDAWLTMVSMMTGAISYAMFVGHATALIQSFDTSRRLYREKFKQVEEYMAYRKLPRALRQRISSYYEHRYQGKMFDENEILLELSECLREQIINYNCRALVAAVPFLTYADQNFVSEIVTKLVFEVYQPGDLIVKEGTMGDRMFFIQEGIVDVIASNGELITSLTEGSYFGEICLLGNTKRVASVRAETYCNLYSLSRDHFLSVLEQYPVMRRTIESIAAERLMQIGLDPSLISKRADLQEDLHTVKEIVQRVAGEQTEDTDETDDSSCHVSTKSSHKKRYHKKKKRQRSFLKLKTHLSVKANLHRAASDTGPCSLRNPSCSDIETRYSGSHKSKPPDSANELDHPSSDEQDSDPESRNAKHNHKRGFRLSTAFLPNFSNLSVRDALMNTFKSGSGQTPTHSRADSACSPSKPDFLALSCLTQAMEGTSFSSGSQKRDSLRPKHSSSAEREFSVSVSRKSSLLLENKKPTRASVERTHSDKQPGERSLLSTPTVEQLGSPDSRRSS